MTGAASRDAAVAVAVAAAEEGRRRRATDAERMGESVSERRDSLSER